MNKETKKALESGEQIYMNVHSGEIATWEGWNYDNEDGQNVNAVDLGEVVPVIWNEIEEHWEEA